MTETVEKKQQDEAVETIIYEQILASIRNIRYGSVEIVIHDGRIVQIERKEKVRL